MPGAGLISLLITGKIVEALKYLDTTFGTNFYDFMNGIIEAVIDIIT